MRGDKGRGKGQEQCSLCSPPSSALLTFDTCTARLPACLLALLLSAAHPALHPLASCSLFPSPLVMWCTPLVTLFGAAALTGRRW